jgi:hypothetical protein
MPTPKCAPAVSPHVFLNVSPLRAMASRTPTSSNVMTGTTKYVRMLHAALTRLARISARKLSWLSMSRMMTPTVAETAL